MFTQAPCSPAGCVPQPCRSAATSPLSAICPVLESEDEDLAAVRRSIKLLLVSNDDRSCVLVRSYLQHLGFSVFICTTTDRAKRFFLRSGKIDVWLVDVQALGLEAMYFALQVRDLHPDTPLIVLSDPGRDKESLLSILWQTWVCIQKPIDIPQLLALIDRALSEPFRELKSAH